MQNAHQTGLTIANLTVRRGGQAVVDDVSLRLQRGEIVAIVGPNGAGKTTLLEAILGIVPVVRGLIRVDGAPIRRFAERAQLYAHLAAEAEPPVEQRVDHFVARASAGTDPSWVSFVQKRLGVAELGRVAAGTLSRGERRRLLLLEALSSGKPFLLLDEPTGVFDPLQLLDVVELFRAAAARGTGMLVTVHQMSDAEAIASRILILSRGRQVALGTLAELRALAGLDDTASLQHVFVKLLRGQQEDASVLA